MSRSVIGLDRFLATLLGLLALVAGATAILFGLGRLDRVWAGAPTEISLAPAALDVTGAGWWVGATAAAGVVAVLLGLWWLLAHIPRRGVSTLALPTGEGEQKGHLRLDAAGPVDVAAEVLGEAPGIRSARGSVLRERGELVYRLRATVDPSADLSEVARAVEDVATDLATCVGRPDARSRVELSVARRHRTESRVS